MEQDDLARLVRVRIRCLGQDALDDHESGSGLSQSSGSIFKSDREVAELFRDRIGRFPALVRFGIAEIGRAESPSSGLSRLR